MRVTVWVVSNTPFPAPTAGRYLVSVLRRLGYRAALREQSAATYFQTLGDSRRHIQIGWFGWQQDYPSPADFIPPLLSCAAFQPRSPWNINDAEFCDPHIDAEILHAQALEGSAPGKAAQTWAAIDRRITNQAPWVPLYNPRLDIATSRRVGNYQYHPFFELLLDQLWVH
jgi:ABC-type transport system substrate-binding protein